MLDKLKPYIARPALYAPGTAQFWRDPHISAHVLDTHLNPAEDAASRQPSFMNKSVLWIASLVPPAEYPALLDLGCGPGLYAERFCRAGYDVTGIDFSPRSIDYAKHQAAEHGHDITYHNRDYLSLDIDGAFDVVTLIYCDFGVLSTESRALLLGRVRRALRPGGRFIFDVFTPAHGSGGPETKDWQYNGDGGFWDAGPHLLLNAFYRYDEDNTELTQAIVVGEDGINCYNLWEHRFTRESLSAEIQKAGFSGFTLYGDVSGAAYAESGATMCAVAVK